MKEVKTIDEIIEIYPILDEVEDFGLISDNDGTEVIIIENSGIEKLIDSLHIKDVIESADIQPYNYNRKGIVTVGFVASVVISGMKKGGKKFYTTSCCHHNNSDFNYELDVAEKRARSKLVRKISGLYGTKAIIGREEIDKGSGKKSTKSAKEIRNSITMSKDEAKEKIMKRINESKGVVQKEVGSDQGETVSSVRKGYSKSTGD